MTELQEIYTEGLTDQWRTADQIARALEAAGFGLSRYHRYPAISVGRSLGAYVSSPGGEWIRRKEDSGDGGLVRIRGSVERICRGRKTLFRRVK